MLEAGEEELASRMDVKYLTRRISHIMENGEKLAKKKILACIISILLSFTLPPKETRNIRNKLDQQILN